MADKTETKKPTAPLCIATATIDGVIFPDTAFIPASIEQYNELLDMAAARPATEEEIARFGASAAKG